MTAVRRFVREQSLSLFFLVLFAAALVGQAFAGWHELNAELTAEGFGPVSLSAYVMSADFAVDVSENWQSEFLQFLLYVVGTVWLLQRGSPESKELHKAGRESDEEQKLGAFTQEDSPAWAKAGGLRAAVYSNSLALVMGAIFLGSWGVQLVAGRAAHNEDRLRRLQDPVSLTDYLASAEFWSRTLQNWQSEFLAVGAMAVLSVYLRQRGSPESKPVGQPHHSTGVEG